MLRSRVVESAGHDQVNRSTVSSLRTT